MSPCAELRHSPPRNGRHLNEAVDKGNHNDLLGEIADAVASGLDVQWDRCAQRVAHGDRQKIENLRVIDQVFRTRPDPARAPQAVGSGGRAGAFSRPVVATLIAVAWVQVAVSVLLLLWSWDSFHRTNGDLAVFLATMLGGHGVGACLLLFAGGRQRRTRALGLYCLLRAAHSSYVIFTGFVMDEPLAQMFPGWYLEFPMILGYLYVPAFAFAPAFLWVFARECPRVHRPNRLDRIARHMVWISAAIAGVLWIVVVAAIELSRAGYATGIVGPITDAGLVTLDLLSFAAALVVALRARSAPVAEANRVLVFSVGIAMYLGVTAARNLAEALTPGSWLANYEWSPTILLIELMRFPGLILLWYSVLATRVPHPREALRTFYRALLTRPGPLGAAAAAPAAALTVIVASRPERTAGAVMADPLAQSLFVAVGIVCLVLIGRDRILSRLDAWMFPETTDQRQILAETATALSRAGRMETVQRTVSRAAKIGSDSPAAVLLAADPRAEDSELASQDSRIAPLPGSSAIVYLLDTVGGPLRVHPEHTMSVFPLLPPQEAAWVLETDTDVILPVPAPGIAGTGALAVGRRFDGRIVRSVDVAFLEALGAMAGIAAQRLSALDGQALAREPQPARECPVCRFVVRADGPPVCECGPAYVEVDVPKLLAGKLQLIRRLGAGGMGAAYLARDLRLDRDVAVKTLAGTSVSPLMQLTTEARAMATLTHPAVAQILSLESWRGRPFLVVEFLPGGTLQERLLRGPVPPAEAVSAILALADGLAILHKRGFLHGDIKPSNIGFTSEGSPKLLDFGLARSTDELAAAGGTLRYVSPEALSGRLADEGDDVWSLCVVLYEMVAGRHPFAGGEPAEVAERISRQRLAVGPGPPPASDAGRAVISFAGSVLAAPRLDRPASALAFAKALGAVETT